MGEKDSRPLRRRRILELTATSGILTGLSGCTAPQSSVGNVGDTTNPGNETDPSGGEDPPDPPSNRNDPDGRDERDDASILRTRGRVELEPVAKGEPPTDLTATGEDGGGVLIASQPGQVHAIETEDLEEWVVLDERNLFLDIDGVYTDHAETGLLGVAAHPDFEENGRVFARYSAVPGEDDPTPYEYDDHVERLSEFRATDDRTRADPDSERVVLQVPQGEGRHNGGDVLFGPDGHLYFGMGEGGSGVGLPREWDPDPPTQVGSSQNTTDHLRGGILRIDVDDRGSASPGGSDDRAYAIPDDNPLVDLEDHRGEYYAWGFRNPWGLSFDGEDLYAADVGQFRFESVNLVEKGGNYGWPIREGTHCYDPDTPAVPPEDCPDRTPGHVRGGEPFLDPLIEYPQGYESTVFGRCVIGGGIYRGDAMPELQGEYVFGDFMGKETGGGRLFVASPPGGETVHPYYRDRDTWPVEELLFDIDVEDPLVTGFGRDQDGELYVLFGAGVYRIASFDDLEIPDGVETRVSVDR